MELLKIKNEVINLSHAKRIEFVEELLATHKDGTIGTTFNGNPAGYMGKVLRLFWANGSEGFIEYYQDEAVALWENITRLSTACIC